MKVELEIAEYRPETGIRTAWEAGYTITVTAGDEIVLRADPAGLRTLAAHLLTLAADGVPVGSHLHYDADAALEPNSVGLILERA